MSRGHRPAWGRLAGALAILLCALTSRVSAYTPIDSLRYDPTVVCAKVGNKTLTLGRVGELIELRRIFESTPEQDKAARRAIVNQWIEDCLVEHEAAKISLAHEYVALAQARREATMTAANLYANDSIAARIKLDSATIDTFYQHHITRYTTPYDQRRLRVITVWKEGKQPKTEGVEFHDSLFSGWYPEDKIDSIYKNISQGGDFALLALAHSEDPMSRGKGGDLGWVSERSLGSDAFAKRVMSQPLNLISKPIETENAWHIAQAYAERGAGPVPIDNEVRLDIAGVITEQQKTKIVKELSDSLLAMAEVRFDPGTESLPHDQLKKGIVLLTVNGRDSIYSDEYLFDIQRWLDPTDHTPPDPKRRADILRENYARIICWKQYLEELGYYNREEVVSRRKSTLDREREARYRLTMTQGPVYNPDSATIRAYYEGHKDLYGVAPNALTLNWNVIRNKLISDRDQKRHNEWLKAASARWNVVRYDDRLDVVPMVPRPKK